MEHLNAFQKEFMETLADIQEGCGQTALCQNDENTLEGRFYDITFELIVRIMELIDGYGNPVIGRLKIIQEKTGESLKEAPFIELHDMVCAYIKDA